MSIVSLCPFDITAILAELPSYDDAWGEERWRQTMLYSPHRDSEVIHLRRQPGSRPRDVIHQLASVATRHLTCAPIARAVDEICAVVQGRIARAMLVRLAPGGVITPHTDIGTYADATERLHLPLITNPGAWLEAGGVRFHLPAGALYALDKHVEHSGGNDGDEARIHLILDYHPDSPEVLAG